MELKIINEKENPLFGRKELVVEIESKVPLKNSEILRSLSEKVKKPEEQVVIKSVRGKFGTHKFVVEGKIYNSKQLREELEGKMPEMKKAEESIESKEDKGE